MTRDPLDQIIRNVVYNEDVRNLLKLKQIDLTHPYGEIIKFQLDECNDNNTSIEQEGFQVGEPFDGDIEHAPVLFLSSNPAFNFDEVSPRYFADSGKVFNPEHISAMKRVKFSDPNREYSFDEIREMFIEPNKEMSPDEIKTFLKTRIQNSPALNDQDQTLRIPLRDGGTKAVLYWRTVKNNTELLLPSALTDKWTNLTPSQKAREIMKYVVCMEIVPFRSIMGAGLTPKLFDKCWEDFTKHLLALSGAEVIVLVRKPVFEAFCRNAHLDGKQKQTLDKHNIIHCDFGGKDRLVVKAENAGDGPGTALQSFNEYNVNTLSDLQKAVADSPLVQKAISKSDE